MAAFFSSVVFQWGLRRFIELGPFVGGALTWFLAQPPQVQEAVLAVLQGNWSTISLGTLVSIGGYLWSYVSTRRNQVTIDGQQVPLKDITSPSKAVMVEEVARTVIERQRGKTLMDLLAEKMGRR
jgi:hypothetical protein